MTLLMTVKEEKLCHNLATGMFAESAYAAAGYKPDAANAYYARGNAYGHLGDDKRAIRDYSRTIVLKPDYAAAYRYFLARAKRRSLVATFTDMANIESGSVLVKYNLELC